MSSQGPRERWLQEESVVCSTRSRWGHLNKFEKPLPLLCPGELWIALKILEPEVRIWTTHLLERERERESVCVCVCVRERERERRGE